MLQTFKKVFTSAASNDDMPEAAVKKLEHELKPMREKLSVLDASIAAFELQREDAVHNGALYGYESEVLRAASLTSQLETANKTRIELSGSINAIEANINAVRAREAEQEAISRIRSIPGLRRRYSEGAATIESLTTQLGDAMRAQLSIGKELATVLDTAEAKRLLGPGAIFAGFQRLIRHFSVEPLAADGGMHRVLFFENLATPGKLPRDTLTDHVNGVLAEIAGFYATREDALTARKLADPSGENLHIVEDSRARVWTLRRGHLRGGFRPIEPGDSEDET
jgi:hypothetical protein